MKIYRLYRRSFPPRERKPILIIRSMQKSGRTDVWYFESDGRFAGFAATINGESLILLDYLAVEQSRRDSGLGSEMLGILREKYAGRGLFVEIEKVGEDAPNPEQRRRREHFYLAGGMARLNVAARVFGVEMELMGWDCSLDFEGYRAFYRDNYGEWAAKNITPADG